MAKFEEQKIRVQNSETPPNQHWAMALPVRALDSRSRRNKPNQTEPIDRAQNVDVGFFFQRIFSFIKTRPWETPCDGNDGNNNNNDNNNNNNNSSSSSSSSSTPAEKLSPRRTTRKTDMKESRKKPIIKTTDATMTMTTTSPKRINV
jgi:hypothetical protein